MSAIWSRPQCVHSVAINNVYKIHFQQCIWFILCLFQNSMIFPWVTDPKCNLFPWFFHFNKFQELSIRSQFIESDKSGGICHTRAVAECMKPERSGFMHSVTTLVWQIPPPLSLSYSYASRGSEYYACPITRAHPCQLAKSLKFRGRHIYGCQSEKVINKLPFRKTNKWTKQDS